MTDPPNHGKPWAKEHRTRLLELYRAGYRTEDMAEILGRKEDATLAQLERLGVLSPSYDPWTRRPQTPSVLIKRHEITPELLEAFQDPMCTTSIRSLVNRQRRGEPLITRKEVPTMNDDDDTSVYYAGSSVPIAKTPKTATPVSPVLKGPTMDRTKPAVETRTFIFGVDGKLAKDEDIYALIKQLEKEIDDCNAIRSKPAKLKSKIAELEKQIAELVTYVDSR